MKRTTIYIDDVLILKAHEKGLSNISDFCRLCVEDFVQNGPVLKNPIEDAARETGSRVIRDLSSQKTLEEEKIRCWDTGSEIYRLVPKSEIARNPDWYIIDEESGRYEA